MNCTKYFIFITLILCSLSVSSFSAQKLKAIAISGGEQHSLVVADNNEVFSINGGSYRF
jgi:hypothetical protein